MNELADSPTLVFVYPMVSAGVLLQSQMIQQTLPIKSMTTYPPIIVNSNNGIIKIASQIKL